MAPKAISVQITGDYNNRDVQRAINDLNLLKTGGAGTTTAMGGLSSGMKVVGLAAGVAAVAVAGMAVKFGVDAIQSASDLNETMSKAQVIFGDAAQGIFEFAETANTSLGQTKQQAIDAAATFAIFGKSAGLTGKDLQNFSTDLVSLSADLGSFHNAASDEVIMALGSALRGEAEPMRRFGVLLDDASLKAQAMAMGIYEGTGSLTQQQKVLSAQALILAQTTDAQGDFDRTSSGLANTTKILTSSFHDLQLSFGEGFLKGLGNTSGATENLQSILESLKPVLEGLGEVVGVFSETLLKTLDSNFQETTKSIKGAEVQTSGFATMARIAGGFVGDLTSSFTDINSPLGSFAYLVGKASGGVKTASTSMSNQEENLVKLYREYVTTTGAVGGFIAAQNTAGGAVGLTTNAIITQFAAMSRINQNMQDAATRAIFVASADDTLRLAAQDAAAAVSSLGGSSGGAAKASDTLTKAQERVAEKIKNARTETDAAIKTFTDYRDSVAESFNGMLDLGAAFESFTERQTNLATAQKALTDFQTSIVGEATDSQIASLTKLQTAYHDASESAAKGSQSVVEEFEAQGRKLQEFGENLSRLVAAGLGRRAFDAIRGMTAERGAELSASLVGGMIEENVARINSVYDSINTMALSVGNQGVTAFEQVGLTMASAMIEAMLVVVNGKGRARLKAMLDDLNAAMNVAAAGGPMPAAPVGGSSRAPAVPFVDASGVTRLLTPRAHGGPVSAGRSYMVGEVGPELFTPSTSGNITPNSAMGGNTYNINVNAGVGDPRAIGQQIVEYVKRFEKANGPVFVAA